MEAKHFYEGLPSKPVLVARTSPTLWEEPTGLEANWTLKELHPASPSPEFTIAWRGVLGSDFVQLLDSEDVKWNSIDVVRIGVAGQCSAPVIIWVGVVPGALSSRDGAFVASKCQGLLNRSHFTDVYVEIRESVVRRLATGDNGSEKEGKKEEGEEGNQAKGY